MVDAALTFAAVVFLAAAVLTAAFGLATAAALVVFALVIGLLIITTGNRGSRKTLAALGVDVSVHFQAPSIYAQASPSFASSYGTVSLITAPDGSSRRAAPAEFDNVRLVSLENNATYPCAGITPSPII